MGRIVLINITSECMAVAILSIIAIACALHKRKNPMNFPFVMMLRLTIILLSLQIISWGFGYILSIGKGTDVIILLNKAILVTNYILIYIISVFMTYYVITLVKTVHPFEKKKQNIIRKHHIVQVTAGYVLSLVFLASMWTHTLYEYDVQGTLTYKPGYFLFVCISVVPSLFPLMIISDSRKYLGPVKTGLMLSYFLVPIAGMPVDLRYNLSVAYLSIAFILVIIYLAIDLEYDNELLVKEVTLAKHEKDMACLQMNMVMTQIQPHFLYNTLSSISFLCTENPEEAALATRELSSFLKGNLNCLNETEPIDFSTEIHHVEQYLNIQRYRFADRMKVIFDIQTVDFLIPALTVQTIVENSIIHAVTKKSTPTTITISSKREGNKFVVAVEDDGPGFDTTQAVPSDRPHIGISCVRLRLEEMVQGELLIESEVGRYTKTTVFIPDTMEILV